MSSSKETIEDVQRRLQKLAEKLETPGQREHMVFDRTTATVPDSTEQRIHAAADKIRSL